MARGLLPLINDTIFLDNNQCIPLDERGKEQVTHSSPDLLVTVMPNPANTGWNIQNGSPERLNYILSTINGQAINSGNLEKETTWLAANDLETGLYFLYVIDPSGAVQVEKLQLIR